MRNGSTLILALLFAVAACSGDRSDFVACENDIVVFEGVPCAAVEFDDENLPADVEARIDELRTQADVDPTKAVANAQAVQRLLASQPFQVCEVMQNDPDSSFLTTDDIAPVAAELAQSTCPTADALR